MGNPDGRAAATPLIQISLAPEGKCPLRLPPETAYLLTCVNVRDPLCVYVDIVTHVWLFVREPASIALESLWAHKLRSFLTLLGVMIAVTALIGVVAAVNGLNIYVAERLPHFGVNVFFVARFPIITNAKDYLAARRHNRKLNVEDYEYLHDHVSLAQDVGAQDWRTMDVRGERENIEDVTIRGTTANMIDIG